MSVLPNPQNGGQQAHHVVEVPHGALVTAARRATGDERVIREEFFLQAFRFNHLRGHVVLNGPTNGHRHRSIDLRQDDQEGWKEGSRDGVVDVESAALLP